MYQRQLKKIMEVDNQSQFITRVGNYPVVADTVSQVLTLYSKAKDSNELLKTSLERAENGATYLAPVVAKVGEKLPLDYVNAFGVYGLENLEHKLPIVTKPTGEILDETKKLYEHTLKPSVDRVQSAGQYAADRYTDAKQYADAKIQDLTQYGTDKASEIKAVGTEKLGVLLQSSQGQVVVNKLDSILAVAETYVDKYLPEKENQTEKDPNAKPRQRLYNRAMRELKNVQLRSQETVKNLDFTVDLIQYAKTNFNNVNERVHDGLTFVQDKGRYYWDEISKEEESAAEQDAKTVEEKALKAGRLLSKQLRNGLYAINDIIVPSHLMDNFNQAKEFTSDLTWSFMKATNVDEVPEYLLTKAKDQLCAVQSTLWALSEYVNKVVPHKQMAIEMDTVSNGK